MNKILLLSLSVLCVAAFADTYLVKADLDASRLDPFARANIAVIAELEHTAILLVNEEEFNLISNRSFEVLDENPMKAITISFARLMKHSISVFTVISYSVKIWIIFLGSITQYSKN